MEKLLNSKEVDDLLDVINELMKEINILKSKSKNNKRVIIIQDEIIENLTNQIEYYEKIYGRSNKV